MKFPITLLCAALYLFSSVEANISTTSPFNGITWNGGETVVITWKDDGTIPKLQDMGETTVDLMVGGPQSQFLAGNIGKTAATSEQISYTVPKDIGPPGNFYFIKYTAGETTAFSGSFAIEKVNGEISGFDPKNPNGNATTPTATDAAATSSASPSASSSATSQDPYAASSTPDPNAAASASSSASGSSPASGNSTSKSLPSEISNDGNNLLPSFVGVATAAIAFTYLY